MKTEKITLMAASFAMLLGGPCPAAESGPARMTPCGDAQAFVVQTPPSYNSWPMIQAVGGRHLLATYSGTERDNAVFVVSVASPAAR